MGRLYTRRGDFGHTELGGQRVSKADPWVEAVGEVDEACALLGFLAAGCELRGVAERLKREQRALMRVGAVLHDGGQAEDAAMIEAWVGELERDIDRAWEGVELRSFILPGGSWTAAGLHWARAVVRRAERAVAAVFRDHLEEEATQGGAGRNRAWTLTYLNRLSDWLFAQALSVNRVLGEEEERWP